MKRWIATLSIAALLTLGVAKTSSAAEVDKQPLNLGEIAEFAIEEQADASQLEHVEAGDLGSGAGILILVIIGIAIAVAS